LRYSITVLLTMIIILIGLTLGFAHENSGKIHSEGGIGPCYGWNKTTTDTRVCYLDAEKTDCRTIIYSHGTWHESDERKCTEEDRG
jgi:hypothetical protein